MITFFSRGRASSLALAVALATGGAVVTTAVYPTEASAQRRDRDKKDEEKVDGGGYTDEFRAAYAPLDELLKTEGADFTGTKPQFVALAGLLTTKDEEYAGGNMVFNGGIKLQDRELQLLGMRSMLSSGMVPAENVGRFNFIAYQVANQLNQQSTARTYLQAAIDNNFSTENVSASSLRVAMMESFFAGGEYDAGFAYLNDAIETQKSQGLAVDESWYRRGVTVAYENELPAVYQVVTMWLSDYPTQSNWRDAINIARNLNDFQPAEMLDLFRLSRRAGALSEASDFDYYVEVADARRLPSEVKTVIEEGRRAGVITDSNLFIAESLGIANSRLAADRADLPALERDASAASAGVRTVVAAGDAFLSYGQYGKAAGFYERSLTMPGVKTDEELTRLAIAQIGQGDYAGARASLSRVSGTRMPIAMLWTAYANQLEGASSAAPAVMPSSAPATAEATE